MRKGLKAMLGAIVVGALGLAGGAARADVVYDNMNPTAPNFQPMLDGEEVGDDVTLAGTARTVTHFLISLTSTYDAPYTGTFTARFYLPNGGDDGFGNPLPGTMLWEGTTAGAGTSGTREMAWTVPNVLVPDTFIWSLEFDTSLNPGPTDPDSIGPDINSSPSVGSSSNILYFNDGTGWSTFNYEGQIPDLANLQAQITAEVLEPDSLGSLAAVALVLIGRRRR
jgi:hypothetical protein